MIFFIYLTSSKILSFEYEKKIYAFLLHFTHLSVSLQRFKCSYHMKRLLILTTLFVLCLCMTAQTPSIIDRPKVGLVLGGGGTKGAAELGALKVIEELNIPIDYIAGTSIGAILGGLYATGYRAEQLDSLFRSGLWMTDNVLELLERLTETDEWIDFENFYNWAINNGYKDGLTIERIDVNGNYCPENCKWIDMKEQAKNRRNNIILFYKGKQMILKDIAKEENIDYKELWGAYKRNNNNLEKALKVCNLHKNNLIASNKSGHRGVYFYKNRWVAYYNQKYIGRYKTFDDAVNARLNAEKQYKRRQNKLPS